VKNNVLVGRGGGEAGLYWVRRQLGQMRYPLSMATLLSVSRSAASTNWTVALPGKPVLPDEVDSFAVELLCVVGGNRTGMNETNLGITFTAEGVGIARVFSDNRSNSVSSSAIINLAKDRTSINFATIHSPANSGNMTIAVYAMAYHY